MIPTFLYPLALWIAVALVVLGCGIAILRRIAINRSSQLLISCGAILFALAAGRPVINQYTTGSVAVMVDLSPSTRGATFRDRTALEFRIHQLLGKLPYQMLAFSDHTQPLPAGQILTDLPADQTVFIPPVADAVLLFSDGQFQLPATAPPLFPVIDPALDHPDDGAVKQLNIVGRHVIATVHSDASRHVAWTGATPDTEQLATPTGSSQIVATLSPGDRWPENDSLSINLPPPTDRPNWWIGNSCPPGWLSLAELPADPAAFLQPAIIALNNISADALSSAQQVNLLQYVRDLGGSLLIVGGDHAFAAGNYDGSLLETLSPLSSSPPLPTQRWLLLIDGSGSMAGDPWQTEIAAVAKLLPQLPPHDPIVAGSFARTLNWWTGNVCPSNLFPTGPTNLAAALRQIMNDSDGSLPSQLLLMTDADTELPNPDALSSGCLAKQIHLHLLAIGRGKALLALQQIASSTHGSIIEQLDPTQWINSAKLLLRSALPNRIQHTQVQINPPPPGSVTEWNQTWLKPSATLLQQSAMSPMTARWQFGLGQVIALAYAADPAIVQSFAKQIAAAPRDPRCQITCGQGATLHLKVSAIDGKQYLNGQSLSAEIDSVSTPLQQTAPGQYEVALPAPRVAQILTVKNQGKVLERLAIAGRYPPEFNAIGNDLENLKTLAAQTGGSVIQPGPVHPIDFRWPNRQTDISSELAFAGFVLISAGMIWEKRSAL